MKWPLVMRRCLSLVEGPPSVPRERGVVREGTGPPAEVSEAQVWKAARAAAAVMARRQLEE